MTVTPWLSVLIPTYNGEAYLAAALDSIVLQADPDIECIVVDDGSTDGTLSILDSYTARLPLIVMRPGHSGNWVRNTNLGLSAARGRYLCFLHQDDLWLPGRLRELKELARAYPDISLLLDACVFVNARGKLLGHWHCPLPALPRRPGRDLVLARLLVQNFVPIPGPIFLREAALHVGCMDESAWYTADWDFWLKLSETGSVGYFARPLAAFRLHPASQTVVRSAARDEFREQLQAIAGKHLATWNPPAGMREKVQRLSDFSIQANTTLAAAAHRQKAGLPGLLRRFLELGVAEAYEYLRDSRIWERGYARLRARLGRTS